jgi:DNA-binding Lrp family transcriptional regulator
MSSSQETAYVLINVAVNHIETVYDVLKERVYVKFANIVYGPYDIIAVIQIEDRNQLSDLVFRDIHSIDGILHTTTCICLTLQ